MKENTLKVDGGIEVYEHSVPMYADQYIREELGGDEERVRGRFPGLLLYIHDRLPRPSNDDIELLNGLFDVYIRLCCRYGTLPSLEGFSLLSGINNSTLVDWKNGEYRKSNEYYSRSVKAWKETCKAFVIDRLNNSNKAEINLIFVAKACHGLRETAPALPEEITSGPELSRAEISARYQAFQEAPAPLELDEIE